MYMRYLGDLYVQLGVFGVGLLYDSTQILLRPTAVAMATKFKTNSATNRLV